LEEGCVPARQASFFCFRKLTALLKRYAHLAVRVDIQIGEAGFVASLLAKSVFNEGILL
jgi:hypothetical protein